MNNKKNNQSKKHLRNWLLALIALVLLVVLAVWPTDYYIEYPGEAMPVGQFIKSSNKRPNNFSGLPLHKRLDILSYAVYLLF